MFLLLVTFRIPRIASSHKDGLKTGLQSSSHRHTRITRQNSSLCRTGHNPRGMLLTSTAELGLCRSGCLVPVLFTSPNSPSGNVLPLLLTEGFPLDVAPNSDDFPTCSKSHGEWMFSPGIEVNIIKRWWIVVGSYTKSLSDNRKATSSLP